MIPGQWGASGGEKGPNLCKIWNSGSIRIKYGCMVDVVYNLRVWISFPNEP